MEKMRKYCYLLLLLSFAWVNSSAEDYSKMSANELNEALIIALKKGLSDEVQKLIQAGANINQKINYTETSGDCDWMVSSTLLEYAAKRDYVNIVKLIRAKATNEDINAALILAAEKGHANVVRELVQAKAKVDVLNTALVSAANNFPGVTRNCIPSTCKDYLNVIKELIKAGANVNHADKYGNTALIKIIKSYLYTEAQKKNRAEIIQALLKAKANVNHANKIGDTALIQAIEKHDFDTVQILLQIPGININHANNDGNTALIIALQCIQYTYVAGNNEQYNNCRNSQSIVEKLLKTPGINLHHVNKNGDTAIKLLEKMR